MKETRKPQLFHVKNYLTDLDSMIQTEYLAQMDSGVMGGTKGAMVSMLVELELKERER